MSVTSQQISEAISYLQGDLVVGDDVQSGLVESGRGHPPCPPSDSSFFNVPAWVAKNLGPRGITITEHHESEGTTLYYLSECPFNSQHKSPDSTIGLRANGSLWFKCFHDSCSDKNWGKLRKQFELKVPKSRKAKTPEEIEQALNELAEATRLPVIDVGDRQLRDVITEVSEAIIAAGERDEPLLYFRGAALARVLTDPEHGPKIDIVGPDAMRNILSTTANFVRTGATGFVETFPPADLARVMAKSGKGAFPRLAGVTEIPVMKRDGTVLERPGYDSDSGLYYCPSGPVPVIPESPTQEDAANAAAFVLDSICDFPFQDDCSRANMCGLLLSVVIKNFVNLIPLALIDSPIRGTGKTRLAQLTAILAMGHEVGVSSEVGSNDEWRKQISSKLLEGAPVIILDNLERVLFSPQIAAVLTAKTWSDRLLGSTTTLTLPSEAVWVATGNNIKLGGDLGRRAYWIRLDARVAQPWLRDTREFRHPFPSWFLENRNALVVALLTMAKAWFIAGSPEGVGSPMGSFEKWAEAVGGILAFAGIEGFLGNLTEFYEVVDEEPRQWDVFFETVFELFQENPFTINDLIDRIQNNNAVFPERPDTRLKDSVPECLGDMEDRQFSSRLGMAIKRRRDQRFIIGDKTIQLQEWRRNSHTRRPSWKMVELDS